MPKNFDLYIGVDQTGATNNKGIPHKLPLCIIYKNKIYPNLSLSSLNFKSIELLISNTTGIKLNSIHKLRALILIDSVFALPQELKINQSQLFAKARHYHFNHKYFGALTAFNFFCSFLISDHSRLPQRLIETKLKANSVFKLKPYQRNIGCGSYRILKELSNDPGWFNIWPIDNKQNTWATISEGYPSYYWKTIFKLKNRPQKLEFTYKNKSIQFKSVDHMDAFILAIAALKYQNQIKKSPNALAKKEGWVLGVP